MVCLRYVSVNTLHKGDDDDDDDDKSIIKHKAQRLLYVPPDLTS
jgi:hypothetical protein